MRQEKEFSTGGEGDAWFTRNKDKMGNGTDPVIQAIEHCKIVPMRVLEVGCSNGWRLDLLKEKYGCTINGAEPSLLAVGKRLDIANVSAHELRRWYMADSFDLVIFGFCLYLCDREDLFKIAYHADAVLRDGGHMIVHDFVAPAHSRIYEHKPELRSYKMDHSRLFSWNPAYQIIHGKWPESPDEDVAIVLKKDIGAGWPLRP